MIDYFCYANYFCKTLHLRCLSGFRIHLCLVNLIQVRNQDFYTSTLREDLLVSRVFPLCRKEIYQHSKSSCFQWHYPMNAEKQKKIRNSRRKALCKNCLKTNLRTKRFFTLATFFTFSTLFTLTTS